MGPCVWKIWHSGGGREAVGSLALDAVSRLGLPPFPSINLNSCTRLRQTDLASQGQAP
jgi:transposase